MKKRNMVCNGLRFHYSFLIIILLLFNACGVSVKTQKYTAPPAGSTVPDQNKEAVIIEEDPYIPPLHQDQVGAVPGKDESDRTSEGKNGESSEANHSENTGVATPSTIKRPHKINSTTRPVISDNQLQNEQQDLTNSVPNSSATDLETQFENYKVLLMAEKKVSLSKVCQLKVSIGLEKYLEVSSEKGMSRDSMIIKPKFIARSAKITPFAPDFDIMPTSEECIIIDPNGSDVRFSLTPKKTGIFKVSADVRLYETEDCTGKYVPKSPKSLMVDVEINKGETINHGLAEMLGVVWEKFMSFWGVLVVLLLSALLFVIRKYVKKKTNYDEKEDGPQF
ncbi:MAG TPA: hypothetical protein VLZ83_01230 [Edaphocola sp.]|nr:hypothetical protein [Edaphocola sp.]